jgi:hypothetical protein
MATIIIITIIVTGLISGIGKNYTKKPIPRKVVKWMMQDNDNSVIDVFSI